MTAVDIDLPRFTPRVRGTLLESALEIPDSAFGPARPGDSDLPARERDRWRMFGVTWLPDGAPNVRTVEAGCSVIYDKSARELPDVVTQRSFGMYDALTCSTLGPEVDYLLRRVVANLDIHASAEMAGVLESGDAGTIGLVGNTTYPPTRPQGNSALSLTRAFFELEQFLALTLDGALGVIHIPAAMLSYAPVIWRGDHFETRAGHTVIADAGMTGGQTPNGGAAPGANTRWIYATGPVWWKLSPVMPQLGEGDAQVHRTSNTNRPLAERWGLVAFDPNILAAALVNLNELCCGGGGGGEGDSLWMEV